MPKKKTPAPKPAPNAKVRPLDTAAILAETPAKKRRAAAKRVTSKAIGVYDAERDILDQYLHEVSRTALLTAPQELAIAKLVRAGDEEAMQELVKRNLRFVISVAK